MMIVLFKKSVLYNILKLLLFIIYYCIFIINKTKINYFYLCFHIYDHVTLIIIVTFLNTLQQYYTHSSE